LPRAVGKIPEEGERNEIEKDRLRLQPRDALNSRVDVVFSRARDIIETGQETGDREGEIIEVAPAAPPDHELVEDDRQADEPHPDGEKRIQFYRHFPQVSSSYLNLPLRAPK